MGACRQWKSVSGKRHISWSWVHPKHTEACETGKILYMESNVLFGLIVSNSLRVAPSNLLIVYLGSNKAGSTGARRKVTHCTAYCSWAVLHPDYCGWWGSFFSATIVGSKHTNSSIAPTSPSKRSHCSHFNGKPTIDVC